MSTSLFTYFGEDIVSEQAKVPLQPENIVPSETRGVDREIQLTPAKPAQDPNTTTRSATVIRDLSPRSQPISCANASDSVHESAADTQLEEDVKISEDINQDGDQQTESSELPQMVTDIETPSQTTVELGKMPELMDAVKEANMEARQDGFQTLKVDDGNEESQTEKSVECLSKYPQSIKGLEAPPLTPEQLKLIPKLMEVVHVGHNADVKTEQTWIKNNPKQFTGKGKMAAISGKTPDAKCMFGMILSDTPRNHNWTAFRELDDCMKSGKPFNFKPDRNLDEMFHDTETDQISDEESARAACPFLKRKKTSETQNTSPEVSDESSARAACPFLNAKKTSEPENTLTTSEESKEACPFLEAKETGENATGTPKEESDVEFMKDHKHYPLLKNKLVDLKSETVALESSNRAKMEEVKNALEKYSKQLEEFRTLQNQLLSLNGLNEAVKEPPRPMVTHRNEVQSQPKVDRTIAKQELKSRGLLRHDLAEIRQRQARYHGLPRLEMFQRIDEDVFWKILVFSLMCAVAKLLSFFF